MHHFANMASVSHWAVLAADGFMLVLLSRMTLGLHILWLLHSGARLFLKLILILSLKFGHFFDATLSLLVLGIWRWSLPCYLAIEWTSLFLITSKRKTPRRCHISDIWWNPFSWKVLIGMIHQLVGNSCPCCCSSCHCFYKHVCIPSMCFLLW